MSQINYFVLLLLFPALAQAGGNGEALRDLQSRLEPMENLSADFIQRVTSADGFTGQEVEGKLVVARPGKLRWQSNPPYEQLVVSDATQVWVYDPDLEQVSIRPFFKDIARTPAILFIGEVGDLEGNYRVTGQSTDGGTLFTLIPRDRNSLFERVDLLFSKNTPMAMDLWDSLGQVTHIQLENVVINGTLAPDLFEFIPPEGVDILRDN